MYIYIYTYIHIYIYIYAYIYRIKDWVFIVSGRVGNEPTPRIKDWAFILIIYVHKNQNSNFKKHQHFPLFLGAERKCTDVYGCVRDGTGPTRHFHAFP